MMLQMTFHNLNFRAFIHATEDDGKVVRAVAFASGSDDIKRTKSSGYHGNPITILQTMIKSKTGIDLFFKRLGAQNIEALLGTLDKRIDDDCTFFLRLDKQEGLAERMVISEKDDVIALRGKIKAYPCNRETAFKAVNDYLGHLFE
jgi:RNA binding exosome subunit